MKGDSELGVRVCEGFLTSAKYGVYLELFGSTDSEQDSRSSTTFEQLVSEYLFDDLYRDLLSTYYSTKLQFYLLGRG